MRLIHKSCLGKFDEELKLKAVKKLLVFRSGDSVATKLKPLPTNNDLALSRSLFIYKTIFVSFITDKKAG